MDQQALEVRVAFERYLETQGLTLVELTLGSAFKTMLEFHSEAQFAWADRGWDIIHLEWDEERVTATQSDGFLGLFRTNLPGQVIGHSVVVSRSLDTVNADEGEDFVIISVKLHYAPNESLEQFFAGRPDERRTDSSASDRLETFAAEVLELCVFKTLAFTKPQSVELMLET